MDLRLRTPGYWQRIAVDHRQWRGRKPSCRDRVGHAVNQWNWRRSATYQQPGAGSLSITGAATGGPSSLERAPGRFRSSETAETRRVVLALDRCHCPAAVRRGLALLPLASGSTSTPHRRSRSTLSTRSAGGCIRRFRCTAFRSSSRRPRQLGQRNDLVFGHA